MIKMPCVLCGIIPSDRAHIKTRGAGAGWEPDEYLHLCRWHHVEQGQIGWKKFCDKYPPMVTLLAIKGWTFTDRFGISKIVKES